MTYNPNDITATFAYIWRPGGTTLGNVLSTWAEVQEVIASHSGTILIFVDDSLAPATVPVGTTDCQSRAVFTSAFQHELPSEVKMILLDGAILHDVRGIEGFLTVQTQGTTTPNFTFTNDRALGLNDGGIIENVGTQPAIRVAPGGFFVITFAESSIFVNTVVGAGPLVDLGLGATAVLYTITGGGYTTDNTVTSAGAAVAQFQFDASLANFPANPGFAGTTQKFVLDDAQFVSYEPAIPANWPIVPTQVAQALDELAARTEDGFGAIIYKPGIPSIGDTVATWPEVQAAIAAYRGKLIVYVDDSIVSPALVPGATGVTECFGRVILDTAAGDSDAFTGILQIEDGATLLNLNKINVMELRCNCQSATPSLDWNATANGGYLQVQGIGKLSNAATATQPAVVLVGKDLFLDIEDSFLSLHNPAVPFFSVGAGAALEFNAYHSVVPPGFASGPAGAGTVELVYDNVTAFSFSPSGVVPLIPAFSGTYTTSNASSVWETKVLDVTTMSAPNVGDVPQFNVDNTWHAGPPPLSPVGFGAIIYKPGTPSVGDHVATWPEVQTFITQADGKCIVYVDDSIVSPALVPGATGITECFGRVELRPFATDALLFTTLQIEPGATLNNLYAITAMELRCNPQTATPSLNFTLTAGGGYLAITEFGALTNAITATTSAIALTGTQQFYLDLVQGLFALRSGANFVNFTTPFISMAGTAEVFINAYDGSLIGGNFASGVGSINFIYDTPTAREFVGTTSAPTVPAFTGTYSTSNVDHPLTTEWGTQATWFIDPQNVTGLADDENSGIDAAHPVLSYNGGIVQKWGSVSPTLKQNTTITWLSSQLTDADPVVFTPQVSNAVAVLNATFGAGQIVHSGALATVTPKNRATGQLLQADLGFAAPIGSIVQNTTRGSSLCEVYKLVAGTTFALTQPLTPVTAPVDITAAQAVTEVDTWANGDAFNVLVPISANIVKIAPLTTEYQESPLFFPASVQLQHLNFTMLGGGTTTTTTFIGDDVSILECTSDATIGDTSTNDDLGTFFINTFMSNSVFSSVGSNVARFMYGGAVIASAGAGPTTCTLLFDFDTIVDATGALQFYIEMDQTVGFNHQGLVYIAGTVRLGGIVAFLPTTNVSGATTAWGPGTLDTVGTARIVFGSGVGAAVATFLNAGGLKLNGLSTGNGFDPTTGLWTSQLAVTAANLDLSLGAGGFGGTATNIGGASFTNRGAN